MKVLITGSSGFIGTNFKNNNSNFSIVDTDLLVQKPEEINFSYVDTVLHLAALVHQMKGAPEDEYFKINRDLAFEIAKRAKENGVKHFVFMSTAKVFGESTTGKPAWDEYSDCNPQDAYGKSKWEAEKLIRGLEDDNFKVAIVRSPLVYGAGVRANMLNLIKLVNKVPILPLGGINNRRSMVYVGNLVALIQHIIRTQASGIFIAGDQSSLSTTQLVRFIAKGFNKRIILFKIPGFLIWIASSLRPAIIERLFGSLELDNTSSNNKLNFNPPFSSQDGINEMIVWYQSNI
jgi:nucleoside-diphosphate-sugar epimerase